MRLYTTSSTISDGMLSFPLTDFDANLRFAPKPYAARLEWLMPYGATALFAAGGTGEFFSLEPDEFSQVVKTAIDTCKGRMPIIAGAGGGTTRAIKYAQEAERIGAQGVLLMPHYLTEATQAGLIEHVAIVCKSVKFGVIIYNRAACRLTPESLLQLAERCPNLIGFKDGIVDIERFVSIRRRLGDRFSYLGGLPTAEVFAGAYRAMGCPVYSSAVFNFISEDGDRLLQGARQGRHGRHQPAARRVLPSLHRAAQPGRRLRGEHREGRRHHRRARCRSGASAAARSQAR